ncbi:MAG: TonB-dependent hemoglobin/transferrin/lactoferrin family receptor, partial [Pseudomonadota bacterium]
MLSATLWLIAAASAAEAVPDDAPPDYDVITVEAAKRPVATNEIASRVTVIDAARIDRELAQSIDDLIRYEPGVDVVDQGSRFGFSGFSIRGVGGNRVRTEIDGIATSDAFSIGSFSNASRDFVDVESIKQLEIMRGPASALFGSNALGGVVSYITKGPADYLEGRDSYFDVSAGFNSVNESAVAGGTAALRFGDVSAMLRANTRDGAERDIPGADPLDDDSLNVLAKINFGDIREGGFEVALERFEADSETDVDSLERVQNFSEAFGFPYIIDTTVVRGNDSRERSRLSIGQEWLGGALGTDYLRWRAFWQDSETTQDTFEARESFIAGQSSAVERQRSFLFEQTLAGLEINAVSEFEWLGLENELAYGFEFETADTNQIRDGRELDLVSGDVSSQVGPDLYPVRDFPKSRTDSYGVYLQNRIALGAVTLIPGVRWDRYELDPEPDSIFIEDNPGVGSAELNEDQVSPKFGVLWDLADSWQLYGQYAEGFRAPPVNDVNVGFTNFQFGYTALPNPDLRSESSRGFEVGLRHAGSVASWDLAVFATRYDDFIQSFQVVGFDPINQLTLFQSVNLDEVDIEGAEFQGRFTPALFPDGLSVSVSAAYAEGENRETGEPVNSVAPLNGVLGIDYDRPDGSWGLSLITRASAAQDDLDESDGRLLSPAGYVLYDAIGYWNPLARLRVA